MKTVSRSKVIYTYSTRHKAAEHVKPNETFVIMTEDAFGGQIKTEKDTVEGLDWSKVDGATGPVFVETAKPGDALVVEILAIKTESKGVIVTVPKTGILGEKPFGSMTKKMELKRGFVQFEKNVKLRTRPMIGTIGVTPKEAEVPTGSLGKHGGNMDVKDITAGVKLYLPVFVEGALFAAGDLHAVQADGESCVSAVEVAGEVTLKFKLIRGRQPEWPVLETEESYSILACGDTLDEAAKHAAEAAIKALMHEHSWSFEKAYMFSSLAVDLRINQAVDPKKGVRAVVSKDFTMLKSLMTA
jgi:amidase